MCLLCIQVTLCSNTVRRYRLALVVDVEGVGKEIMTLPINARSDTFTDVNIHVHTYSNIVTHQLKLGLWCLASCCKVKFDIVH